MRNPKIKKAILFGLTGGIATGKTTVAKLLRDLGVAVICADSWAHVITEKGKPVAKKIIRTFGKEIVLENGEIDRAKLGNIVFVKTKARKILESLVHPEVKKQMLAEAKGFKKAGHTVIVLDVPLLFETGWDSICDQVICVYATQTQQIERMRSRNGIPAHQARLRLKAQMPMQEKCKRADIVLKNTKDVAHLKKQIQNLLQKFKSPANS